MSQQFDEIIDDAAARFGLGSKASVLFDELQQLVAAPPDGVGGFIERLQSAGLTREVSGWLGNPNGAALTSSQVENALGSGTVDAIARRVGLPSATAAAALGYLAPKLVGRLTPHGVIDPAIPGSVSDITHTRAPSAAGSLEPVMPHVVAARETSASSLRWILPLLALLIAGGLGWYWYDVANRAPSSAETKAETAAAVPSRLAITNDDGVVTVSGTVRDQASRDAVLDALKSAFGGDKIKADLTINPNAAPSPWLANLPNALAHMKMPGLQAMFEGTTINLRGTIGDNERDRLLSALKPLFGPSSVILAETKADAAVPDQTSASETDAQRKTSAALSALGPRFQPPELLDILNTVVINFPTGSSEIPAASRALLQQAAISFKQLPAGTVIEISGHTDNTGDPHANLQLSQSRAGAVRHTLTEAGVNPAMLVAKGYGDAHPIASNDTAEGRLQNRRIGYQVDKSATVGSGR